MIKLKSLLLEVEGTEPGVYYHVTFQKKLGKIQKDGLVAQKKGEWHGAAGQDIRQVKGVFVFENYYDAMSWCFKTNWDRPTEKLVILKLKTNDTDFVEDSHWQASGIGKWLVKQSPFKPSDISEVIPFDIDKWTPELTLKMNKLRRQSNGISEDLSNTIKLKDLILENVIEERYSTLEDAWFGDYPKENELIWNWVGHRDWDSTKFEITHINPVEWFVMAKLDDKTISKAYEQHATPRQKKLVSQYRKQVKNLSTDSFLIVVKNQKKLVDGFHRLVAMALEGITKAKALNLDEEEPPMSWEDSWDDLKLKEEKTELKWKQKMSRDEMTEFLSDYGQDWQGEIGYDQAKEISGYPDSGQWELKEIPLSNFPDLLADPKKISRMPIVTFGSESDWEIADGKHRVGAAKARGEKTIMGYVPIEGM